MGIHKEMVELTITPAPHGSTTECEIMTSGHYMHCLLAWMHTSTTDFITEMAYASIN